MDLLFWLELAGVILNLGFLVLYIREIRWSWLLGIGGSLLAAYVVYMNGYYSEALLYLFYAVMGVVGFQYWSARQTKAFRIARISTRNLALIIASGLVATLGLGYVMEQFKADKVYLDAFSTVFGIIATILEIYKYYIAWSFWIILNLYSIWLYQIKSLDLLSIQMILYTGMSIYGLVSWTRKLSRGSVST